MLCYMFNVRLIMLFQPAIVVVMNAEENTEEEPLFCSSETE